MATFDNIKNEIDRIVHGNYSEWSIGFDYFKAAKQSQLARYPNEHPIFLCDSLTAQNLMAHFTEKGMTEIKSNLDLDHRHSQAVFCHKT